MVGFDEIDRAFRKPAKIELECEQCQTTKGEIKTRVCQYNKDLEAALCFHCWYNWCPIGGSNNDAE
jgi:hypothetical protein